MVPSDRGHYPKQSRNESEKNSSDPWPDGSSHGLSSEMKQLDITVHCCWSERAETSRYRCVIPYRAYNCRIDPERSPASNCWLDGGRAGGGSGGRARAETQAYDHTLR